MNSFGSIRESYLPRCNHHWDKFQKNARLSEFDLQRSCKGNPRVPECAKSKSRRAIRIGQFQRRLHKARFIFVDLAFRQDCRETCPKAERKLAYLVQCLHGGRRARAREITKVTADILLLVAAQNLVGIAMTGMSPRES